MNLKDSVILQQPMPEPDYPHPPRYRWLKRGLLAGIVIILLLAGMRLWWGYEAQRRLDAEIAARHTRGERVLLEDFQPKDVPDNDNAAYFIRRATNLVVSRPASPRNSNRTWSDIPPLPEWVIVMAEKSSVPNAPALADLRQAKPCRYVEWNVKIQRPLSGVFLRMGGTFNRQRELANLATDAAIARHARGDDDEALKTIEDVLALGEAVSQGPPLLVSHLLGSGIQALALSGVHTIATGMNVESRAARQHAEELIARLQDEREFQASLHAAFQGERMFQLDAMQVGAEKAWFLRPMIQRDAAELLGANDPILRATMMPDWPSARAAAIPRAFNDRRSRLFSSVLAPSLTRAIETYFHVIAERRMMTVALAVRLYALDHSGAYPGKLEDLVPEYLPHVPLDPMAGNNRPLRYLLLEGGKRPLVYCVGEDGVGDTAAGLAPPTTPQYGGWTRTSDQWRDLSRWSPPPAATQAAPESVWPPGALQLDPFSVPSEAVGE